MLVPFAIDAASLTPDRDWAPATVRACHGSLIEVWQRFGLLIHDGEEFEGSALYHSLSNLPQKIRPLWQALLEHYPPRRCGGGWNGLITNAELTNTDLETEVAFVDDDHAVGDFDFSEDEDERTIPLKAGTTIDVCRLQAASRTRRFAEARLLADRHVQPKETYEQIWDKRFAWLTKAPCTTKVAIVDRFAVEQTNQRDQAKLPGLLRFLKLLDRSDDQKRFVTLYSAWTQDLLRENSQSVMDDLRLAVHQLQFTNVRRIELVMLPSGLFGALAHDRFIRLGPYVWDLGLGLRIFEGPCAEERSSATFKAGLAVCEYEDIETLLRGDRGAKPVRILG